VSPETPVISDGVINSTHPSHDVIVVMEILAVTKDKLVRVLFICNEFLAVVVIIVVFGTYTYTNNTTTV